MDRKLFRQIAAEVLDGFDPARIRAQVPERPFMVEFLGLSNSGKTTTMDRAYSGLKGAGLVTAKVVEGAEAVPPPRELPHYNIRTALWAVTNAFAMKYDRNAHAVLFDRGPFDGVVRMDMYAEDGTMTPQEALRWMNAFASETVRDLFDLHVFLMCTPEAALIRKHGPDYAERIARGELKVNKTTSPEGLQAAYDAHHRVFQRHDGPNDRRMVWVDTSDKTQDQVADLVLGHIIRAFDRRLKERAP